MTPKVILSPAVARKIAVEAIIEKMGPKYLLHASNQVKRKPQPERKHGSR